ncbi:MAG: hypothetical protein D6706_03205 [Chloroflexi bacterium]|nr:MAG: hypothetical protein D6706_03205 [Chloroflexota bacterium]
MTNKHPYIEETFGILTDDDLYLDCVLVRPANTTDKDLRVLRVWVPKYPLTKSSVITCARQEVKAYGPNAHIAHLVFDLRGTGESEGIPGDTNFDMDLHAIAAWAEERFGKINFGFLGTPTLEFGTVNMWPLRAGAVMESYHYPAGGGILNPQTLLYLSTYGNFGRTDDLICAALADAGYDVYGLDPLRYLLHASANQRLTPDDLWRDLYTLIQMLPSPPIIIGQPLAAGLALLWASGVEKIPGVIAIGRSQTGLAPRHIFQNSNPYTFLLSRQVKNIFPRPLALVILKSHPLGGKEDEMATLYQSSKAPHRLERVEQISPEYLLSLLEWVKSH